MIRRKFVNVGIVETLNPTPDIEICTYRQEAKK